MVVAIAEATHHIFQMYLCLILMSKCINNDYDNDGDDDDDDDNMMMMI
jgi:hypothetical protein